MLQSIDTSAVGLLLVNGNQLGQGVAHEGATSYHAAEHEPASAVQQFLGGAGNAAQTAGQDRR